MILHLIQDALVAVLVVSTLAKIVSAARKRAVWPEGHNFLWLHVPMSIVVACELLVVVLHFLPPLIPAWTSGAAIAAIYVGFALAAMTLRGRTCACFGVQGRPIGWPRIGINWVAAGAGVISAAVPHDLQPVLVRLLLTTLGTCIIGLVLWTAARLRHTRFARASQTTDSRYYLITSPDCAACTALRRLLNDVDLSTHGIQVLDKADALDSDQAERLAPGSATPALVVDTPSEGPEAISIVTGAGACYDQIKQLVATQRV